MNEPLATAELPDLLGVTAAPPPDPVVVRFLAPLTVQIDRFHASVLSWGADLIVTDEIRELSKDRNGSSWLDLLGDEAGQIKRWGKVVFVEGPWPDDVPRLQPGSLDFYDARETARQAAWKISDPEERAAALAQVNAEFGPPLPSNKTLQEIGPTRG